MKGKLELDKIYTTLSLYETIRILERFRLTSEKLEAMIDGIMFEGEEGDAKDEMLEKAETLYNQSLADIRVLEDAIMCHETKIKEIRFTALIGVTSFFKN